MKQIYNYFHSQSLISKKSAILILLFNFFGFSNATAQNPLAAAMDFNIFTEENFTIHQGDVEGAMAIGGNFIITGSSQYTTANATGKQPYVVIGGIKYALVVGGGIQGVNGNQMFQINSKVAALDDHNVIFNTLSGCTLEANGGGLNIGMPATDPNFRYIRINQSNQQTSTVQSSTPVVQFASAFATLRLESERISTKGSTVNVTSTGGQANLTLNSSTTNVWNVTGTELNSYSQLNLSGNLPSASNPLVINVNAIGTFNWSMFKFNFTGETDNQLELNRAPYIIWNFYNNTTTLNINASILLIGSILAPNAIVTNNATGNITGQLVAKAFNKPNAGEFHIAKFNASISTGVLAAKSIQLIPTINNDQVNINWQTQGETNSSYFEVERSYNGVDFNTVSKVYSLVPTGGNGAYKIIDNDFISNCKVLYYRIKAVDITGTIEYSSIVTLRINKAEEINIWPNPFVNAISFNYTASKVQVISVILKDVSGKQVKTQLFTVNKGINSLMVANLQGIAPGNYYLIIADENSNKKISARAIKL